MPYSSSKSKLQITIPMKSRTLLLLIVTSISLTSCMSLALNLIGVYDPEATTISFTNEDRSVVFIPMKHIALKEFYTNVGRKADSLQKEGYTVFLESVSIKDSLTKPEKDTLELKFRKVLGTHVSKKGYLDTINGKLMGKKYNNKKGIVNQPRYHKMGIDTSNARVVDVPANVLLKQYEAEFGKIVLTDCDYNTKLEDKYKCGKLPKDNRDKMVRTYREKHLAEAIMSEPNKKVVVIFGALHEEGLMKELKALDSKWKYVEKKKK